MEAITIIDEMITETLNKGRTMPTPITGGANQAPFDGEQLGSFIRFAVLHDVRAKLLGKEPNPRMVIETFNREWTP